MHHFLDTLEESSYRKCRIWSKIILSAIIYIFMFYYQFLINNVELISDRIILQGINVTISSTDYPIVTSNYYNFQQTYSTSGQTVSSLQGNGLWCAIDNYSGGPSYSSVANSESNTWLIYVLTGLFSMSKYSAI